MSRSAGATLGFGLAAAVWFSLLPRVQQSSTAPTRTPGPGQSAPSTGAATGIARAPIKDPQSRPITAGGFVDEQAGLDKFHQRMRTFEKATIVEANGSGVAVLDY